MIETLTCPNCAAPLKFSAESGESMECPFCHTIVLRSGKSSDGGSKEAGVGNPTVGVTPAAVIALIIFGLLVIILGVIVDRQKPNDVAPAATPEKPGYASMILEFGSKGITPGHFENAQCVSVDRQGRIYVGEGDHGRVQVFDASGKYLREFSVGRFDDLAADRDGTVYVAADGKISRFNGANGEKLAEMERGLEDYFGRQTPANYRCICLTPGMVYAIAGYAADVTHIVKLSTTTGRIESTVVGATPPGEIPDLRRVLALTTGEIYGLDTEMGFVVKFSPSGAYVNKFGSASNADAAGDSPPSRLQGPTCMASDSQGRIYIGNSGGIKVFDKDGNYIDGFGADDSPQGITIDEQDHIFACYRDCVREYALQRR